MSPTLAWKSAWRRIRNWAGPAALIPCLAQAACPTCGPSTSPSGLEVHEWGTFTTLSSSAGKPLGGLFVDATRLPGFVHGLPYFNFDAVRGWASPDRLRNVTVKMETPVLYFYSRTEMDVDVKVGFQGGTISQWYPACYDCETDPAGPYVDFGKEPYPGHIGWKAKVLAPGSNLPYTTSTLGESAEWVAPRNTLANQVRGQNGEIERFLFYRGLGNFQAAVALDFLPDGSLRVANRGAEDIGYLMIYGRGVDAVGPVSDAAIPTTWYQGPVKAGGEIRLKLDKPFTQYEQAMAPMEEFHGELVKAGLSTQEARALLNTWYTGYFIENGLKAFWIVPRAQVDRILPLSIAPVPDKLVRVMVGRSEILTPAFEQKLKTIQAKDSLDAYFGRHKYNLAYRDFLSKGPDWHIATSARGPGAKSPRTSWADRNSRSLRTGPSFAPGAGWASPWFSGAEGRPAADAQGRSIRSAYPVPR